MVPSQSPHFQKAVELGHLLGLDGESPTYKELIQEPSLLIPAQNLVSFPFLPLRRFEADFDLPSYLCSSSTKSSSLMPKQDSSGTRLTLSWCVLPLLVSPLPLPRSAHVPPSVPSVGSICSAVSSNLHGRLPLHPRRPLPGVSKSDGAIRRRSGGLHLSEPPRPPCSQSSVQSLPEGAGFSPSLHLGYGGLSRCFVCHLFG